MTEAVGEDQPACQAEDEPQHAVGESTTDQGSSSALSPLLQQQIADAIAPLVGDLQQQIANTVRQQMRRTPSERAGDHETQSRPAEPPEPVHQNAQDETRGDGSVTQRSALEAAVERTVTALRQTLQWLVRTVEALLKTVKALLTAVVGLLQIIVLALAKALTFLFRPVAHALRAAVVGLWEGLKAMFAELLHKLVLAALRSFLRSLLERLSRP